MSRFEVGDEVVGIFTNGEGVVVGTEAEGDNRCWVKWPTGTYLTQDKSIRLKLERPKVVGYASGGYVGRGEGGVPITFDNGYIVPNRILENIIPNARVAKEVNFPPAKPADDPVNHPTHYTSDPSGVECITITQHRNFCVGNAIKYLWRAGLKNEDGREALDKQVEDLEKAKFYIEQEIKRLRPA